MTLTRAQINRAIDEVETIFFGNAREQAREYAKAIYYILTEGERIELGEHISAMQAAGCGWRETITSGPVHLWERIANDPIAGPMHTRFIERVKRLEWS